MAVVEAAGPKNSPTDILCTSFLRTEITIDTPITSLTVHMVWCSRIFKEGLFYVKGPAPHFGSHNSLFLDIGMDLLNC